MGVLITDTHNAIENKHHTAVSQRSEYMILSTELTGWGGVFTSSTFPDNFTVDYVRVYKPKDVSTATTNPLTSSSLKVHPNLVRSGDLVTISESKTAEKSIVNIYTAAGSLLRNFDVTPDMNSQIKMNTAGMTSGIYILRCNNQVGKLVIE